MYVQYFCIHLLDIFDLKIFLTNNQKLREANQLLRYFTLLFIQRQITRSYSTFTWSYFSFYTETSYEKLFNFYVIILFFLYREKLREAIQLLRDYIFLFIQRKVTRSYSTFTWLYFSFYTEKSYEKLINFYVILLFFLYRDKLREAIQLLRTTNNPQIQYLVRTMKKWAKDKTVPV
jgi:hypothetical protein